MEIERNEIADLIEIKHQELFAWLEKQPQENWELGPKGKWSTGQHIPHLTDSLQLLNNALSYPRFFLKYKFGTCNRAPRDYNTVAQKYQQKLLEHQERAIALNQKLKTRTLKERDHLFTKHQIQQKSYNLIRIELATLIKTT